MNRFVRDLGMPSRDVPYERIVAHQLLSAAQEASTA
jgi:hypothetical protein